MVTAIRSNLSDRTASRRKPSLRGGRPGLRGFLPFVGPAVVASIAYMDPGNFATNIQAGARYGYMLLWVVLLANVIAMLFQALSARLGIVTGHSLAALCRSHFPRPVVIAMWVASEIAAMATDLAEIDRRRHRHQPAVPSAAAGRAADHLRHHLGAADLPVARLPADRADHHRLRRHHRPGLSDRAVHRAARLGRVRLPHRGAATGRRGQRDAGGRHRRRDGHAACDLPALGA